MPAISSFTMSDGQTVPVVHTFSPVSVIGNKAIYEDRVSGISAGFPRVTITIMPPTKRSRLHKVRVQITRPVLETVGNAANGFVPPQTKAYEVSFDGMFYLPDRSTLNERKDIFAYAATFLSNTITSAIVKDLESIY